MYFRFGSTAHLKALRSRTLLSRCPIQAANALCFERISHLFPCLPVFNRYIQPVVRLSCFTSTLCVAIMTSAPVWATSARERRKRHPRNINDVNEDIDAIDAIELFLTGGLSTRETARWIADVYEPCLRTRQRNDIATLWAIICQAARSIDGSAATQLAELVIALRNQPDVISNYGKVVEFGHWVYWRELPKFGQMFREHGFGESRTRAPNMTTLSPWWYHVVVVANDCSEIEPPNGNDTEWYAQAPKLLNITVFAANLMVHVDKRPNVSFAASILLDEGIDRPYDDTRELQEEWRMYVPPAAMLMLIAGSKLRELCFMNQLLEDDNKHSVQSRWGGRTYCLERWTFWKQRFLQLAHDTAIDIPCRVHAKTAYREMGRLDDEA